MGKLVIWFLFSILSNCLAHDPVPSYSYGHQHGLSSNYQPSHSGYNMQHSWSSKTDDLFSKTVKRVPITKTYTKTGYNPVDMGGYMEPSGTKTSYIKTGYSGHDMGSFMSPTATKTSYVKTGFSSHGSASPVHPTSGGDCGTPPRSPANAMMRCSQYSGCRVSCLPKHRFPNGESQMFVTCENGEWQVEGTEWVELPACEPICMPECLNNGICISPDRCHCPETFSGPQCQYGKRPCLNYPKLPMNSRRTCSSTTCTVTCMKGYEFPDGSQIVNMECKDGNWVPTRANWFSLPNCQATCNPPCQNGGNCLSYNVCQCPQQYRGPQCQYNSNACNGRLLNFNGGYNCSGDMELFRCSLKCPPGADFSSPPASVYTCRYSEGFFIPSPTPQCQFFSELDSFGSDELEQESGSSQWSKNYGYDNTWRSLSGQTEFIKGNMLHGQHMKTLSQGIPIKSETEMNLPVPTMCITWAGMHYKTFDGEIFSVDTPCAHTLVRDAADDTFSVVIQTNPKCHEVGSSRCNRIMRIFANDREYTLKKSDQGVPMLNSGKKRLPIPVQAPGFRADMSAHFVIIYLDSIGLTIKWDSDNLIQVLASESLWNKTEGMCGKANGNSFDDMLMKDGYRANNPGAFVTSWQADTLGKACTASPYHEHKCDSSPELIEESYTFCKNIMSDMRFAPCRAKMDYSMFLDACRWDFCACKMDNKNPNECVCNTVDVFVRECRHRGVKSLTNWRDNEICPLTCTGGRQYMPCGPTSGQPTCGSPPPSVNAATSDDGDSCGEEGCYCPPGEVLGDGSCITRDECPCWLRGKTFKAGESVPKDCNTCTCVQGQWTCTQVACSARCSAVGDPHYTTFDGKTYDFMGQCSYYLLKTGDNFTVEAENVPCAGAISRAMNLPVSVSAGLPSCTKSVTIRMPKHTIKFGQNLATYVDGKDLEKLPADIDGARIRLASSIYVVLELPNGIEVWWDGTTRVYIDAPPEFRDKTKGLCGTFNANQKDDFLTPEGDVEQSTQSFANKWKTNANCPDARENKVLSGPCEANIQNKDLAENHCKVLKSEAFSRCHWFVDPDTFYQNCLYDMCSCGPGVKISDCLCSNIAAYGQECADRGSPIEWRNFVRECGLVCPPGQEYRVCSDSCQQSCSDLTRTTPCKKRCVEGCSCPEGQVMNDKRECVPVSQCPCQRDGFEFPAGYKEIRPGRKGQDLCVCQGAMWTCDTAAPEDIFKYQRASDIKDVCSAKMHQEFTTCEPAEPVTCNNMHIPSQVSPAVCHPGCICKKGYVLDEIDGKCVQASECPCHHGGKSYKGGDTVQNDCNTCFCDDGKWVCTEHICPGVCSAWGDSHYKTFDGRLYEYQGQCDYLFAKGSLGGADEFDVTIQNVPCSTLGVTCSKSVILAVAGGDTITLTRDHKLASLGQYKLPEQKYNRAVVRQSDVFTIVEVEDLGLSLHWDRGTRVYLRLDSRWKGKTRGLCGNYNDDQMDDFQTPSGGISEVSPVLFGDSWRLKPYCAAASEQIEDACESRPERRSWALRKCGVLKGELFAPCHSEVPVEGFLERCVFDTCACDQGGDCECLCTALAAYAQECNTHGIPIKWRSKELCPMQCDETCSNYSPCISSCPVETCDTALNTGQSGRLCSEDPCIEGCARKPCPEGYIHLNDSTSECVPRSSCKPKCMEINGKIYYEGDLLEEDECQRCHCTRKQKLCVGKPCATTPGPITTTLVPPTTVIPPEDQQLACIPGWTEWINQDGPKPTGGKVEDIEPLPDSVILNQLNPKSPRCPIDMMRDIQCRTVKDKIEAKATGLDVECSLENGLICSSEVEGPHCVDFEMRVLCECEGVSTTTTVQPPGPVCDINSPNSPDEKDCTKFYQCVQGPDGLEKVEKFCNENTMFNPEMQVCDWPESVIKIRPECSGVKCPPGMTYFPCALACEQLCNYFEHVVHEHGLCSRGEGCEGGCVQTFKRPDCGPNMYWRDNATCVKESDCTCRSRNGTAVLPGMLFEESECELCQCLDNQYVCDKTACVVTTLAAPQSTTESTLEEKTPKTELEEDESEEEVQEEVQQIVVPTVGEAAGSTGRGTAATKTESVEPTKGEGVAPGASIKPTATGEAVEPVEEASKGEDEEESAGIYESLEPSVISTATPPGVCKPNKFVSLTEGATPIPDDAYTASGSLDKTTAPWNSRVRSHTSMHSTMGWSPAKSNRKQYLQIDLGKVEPIYGLKVLGHPLKDQYVTSYRVLHSPGTGQRFSYVRDVSGHPKIFRGSVDNKRPITSMFDIPFEAQVLRINPYSWHRRISLRAEVIGCSEVLLVDSSTDRFSKLYPTEIVTTAPEEAMMCDEPMGINEDRSFPDSQLDVSSVLSKDHDKKYLNMNQSGAWQPASNIPNQWVQFDLFSPKNITGVVTKGGPDGWVSAYEIKYSPDMKNWQPILDDYSNDKLFLGNYDKDTPHSNYFPKPIRARIVKILPKKWQKNIQMKAELRGCFEPYTPEEQFLANLEELLPTTTVSPVMAQCNYCPGVDTSSLKSCPCNDPLWWNGEECVSRTRCPCVLGHVAYAVGSTYLTEECEQCICQLGGVPKCQEKVCEKCDEGLRHVITSTCTCLCKPCPPGQTLCPTSNTCINTTSWCDGVSDCPDDEINCAAITSTVVPIILTTTESETLPTQAVTISTTTQITTTTEVKICSTPICPPGYTLQVRKQSLQETLHSNLMFRNSKTASKGGPQQTKGFRKSAAKGNFRSSYLPRVAPTKEAEINTSSTECPNFRCVSTRPLPTYIPPGRKPCPSPDCPPGYTAEVDPVAKRPRTCPTYWCKPVEVVAQQQQTDVCNVTGRTISTFDGTEFKFDICNHILVRDLINGEWAVILAQRCLATCVRHLELLHGDKLIKAFMDLSLEYDGYNFTVEQASRIGVADKSLSMSRVGNALLFISHQYGFWVQWDKHGDVKIGTTPVNENKIDGLCGLYNKNPADDKRMPNGKVTHRTAEFGDSWLLDQQDDCTPRTCPLHLQEIAWKMCTEAANEVFEPCHNQLNPNVWASRCLESTCACLEKANSSDAQKNCRCDALGMYASECAAAQTAEDDWLQVWRLKLDCQAECKAPLVYHDCYRHRCEPTCSNIGDDSSCPAVPGMCFPGCYCPPGYVRHKNKCIPPSECRDCECNVLPYLQYVTYDSSNFTVTSNCTYIVTQDLANNEFTILSSNAPCPLNPEQMCVERVIIVLQGGRHVVVVKRGDTSSSDFVLMVDGQLKKIPLKMDWLNVIRMKARHVNVQALGGKLEVRIYHPTFGFSVRMPSHVYGSRLAGLCGDCDSDPENDMRLPNGKLSDDVDTFARAWQTNDTSCVTMEDKCAEPPEGVEDVCETLLDESRFGRCHVLLDPAIFLATCRHDTCGVKHELACQSLETYAIACAKLGVCVDWHNELCPPMQCPEGSEYRLCGETCPATCDQPGGCGDSISEGCFCLGEGEVLMNGTKCVQASACIPCDEKNHYPGDTWKLDECTQCTCDVRTRSILCQTIQCPEVVCERGYEPMRLEEKAEGECCDKVVCSPVAPAGPTCETPTQKPSCGKDQILKLDRGADGCQQFICECKPADECESIEDQAVGPEPTENKIPDPGLEPVVDTSGCCPLLKHVCKPEKCPAPKTCPKYYKSLQEDLPNRCCPVYKCHAPEDKCLYEMKFAPANIGGERDRTPHEREITAQTIKADWKDGPCRTCQCQLDEDNKPQALCTKTECSNVNDLPDRAQYVLKEKPKYNQCCPEVERVACRDPNTGNVYEPDETWTPNATDPCVRAKCVDSVTGVLVTTTQISCDTKCEPGWKYEVEPGKCCGACKQFACYVPEIGDLKSVGEEWHLDKDLCTKYKCVQGVNGSISVKTETLTCPDAPDQKYMYETKPIEGECCGSFVPVACIGPNSSVQGEGAKWRPSPDADRCKYMKCIKDDETNMIKQVELTRECQTNCPIGWTYTPSPPDSPECCGECVQSACVINKTLTYKPGEEWTSSDGCTSYTCDWHDDTNGGKILMVLSSQETCPDVSNCPPEVLYSDGCCERCNMSMLAFSQCAAEPLPSTETIGIIKEITASHGLCLNTEKIRGLTECHGKCDSSTVFNHGSYESSCFCCQVTKYTGIVVSLTCEDGYKITKQIPVPSECSCEACGTPVPDLTKAPSKRPTRKYNAKTAYKGY